MKEEILKLLNEILCQNPITQNVLDRVAKVKSIIKNSIILSEIEYCELEERMEMLEEKVWENEEDL